MAKKNKYKDALASLFSISLILRRPFKSIKTVTSYRSIFIFKKVSKSFSDFNK